MRSFFDVFVDCRLDSVCVVLMLYDDAEFCVVEAGRGGREKRKRKRTQNDEDTARYHDSRYVSVHEASFVENLQLWYDTRQVSHSDIIGYQAQYSLYIIII